MYKFYLFIPSIAVLMFYMCISWPRSPFSSIYACLFLFFVFFVFISLATFNQHIPAKYLQFYVSVQFAGVTVSAAVANFILINCYVPWCLIIVVVVFFIVSRLICLNENDTIFAGSFLFP